MSRSWAFGGESGCAGPCAWARTVPDTLATGTMFCVVLCNSMFWLAGGVLSADNAWFGHSSRPEGSVWGAKKMSGPKVRGNSFIYFFHVLGGSLVHRDKEQSFSGIHRSNHGPCHSSAESAVTSLAVLLQSLAHEFSNHARLVRC